MPLTTLGKNRVAALINAEAVTPLNTANCYVGVGNSSTAFDVAQTDLQGSSKQRVAATLVSRSGNTLTITASFGDTDAVFAWQEVGVFDASSGGTMIVREVASLGTKAGGTWALTLTAPVG